jgi:hypothetical protein
MPGFCRLLNFKSTVYYVLIQYIIQDRMPAANALPGCLHRIATLDQICHKIEQLCTSINYKQLIIDFRIL